jgi:hypothetical protein
MTKTLQSLAHTEHEVYCTNHSRVAIVPSEALALWMATEHMGTFPECKGKVTYHPTMRITQEGQTFPKGSEGRNGSGEVV